MFERERGNKTTGRAIRPWARLSISLRAMVSGLVLAVIAINVWSTVASETWHASRCVRRSDIPGFFLVDKRRRFTTLNESCPRYGASSR